MIQTQTIDARSRGYYSSADPYFKFQLGIETLSQSVTNNTTRVRIWVGLASKRGSSGAVWSNYGTSYGPFNWIYYSLDNGATWTTVVEKSRHGTYTSAGAGINSFIEMDSWTGDIPHNDDGTRTMLVKFYWKQATNPVQYDPRTTEDQFSVTLPTIARASTVSLGSTNITLNNINAMFAVSVTAKASFYHKMTWSLGSQIGVTPAGWNPKYFSGTEIASLRTEDLLNAMPTTTSGTLTVYVTTYSSSSMSEASKIGETQTAQATVTIAENAFLPTVNLTSVAPADYPTGVNRYIAGYSKANVSFNSVAGTGSFINRIEFACVHGMSASSVTPPDKQTTYSGQIKTALLGVSSEDYSVVVYATCYDARGKQSVQKQISFTALGYQPPTINTDDIYRCTSIAVHDTPDDGGQAVYIEFTASAFNSETFTGNSIQTLTCFSGETQYYSGSAYALSEDASITFTITARDILGEASQAVKTVNIPTAVFALDLYDDNNQSNRTIGAAFGGIAEPGKVKSKLPVYAPQFYGDLEGDVTGDLTGNADTATEADHATEADTATTATKSTKQEVSTANPASSTSYYPAFYPAQSGDRVVYANDGLKYLTLQGTASALGYGGIRLGNTTNQGTAGNKWGFVDVYPQTGAYYARIRSAATLTANRTAYLPDGSGTVELKEVLWTGNLQGGNSITLNTSAYRVLKIYANLYGHTTIFEMDITEASTITTADGAFTANDTYRCSGTSAYHNGSRVEVHYAMVAVNSTKSNFYFRRAGFGYGTSYNNARNNNADYYIYRIEGYL